MFFEPAEFDSFFCLDRVRALLEVTAKHEVRLSHVQDGADAHENHFVSRDIDAVLRGLDGAISSAGEQELTEKSVLAHLKARGRDEERTVEMLLDGLFARHWREHLEQMRELRNSLGM